MAKIPHQKVHADLDPHFFTDYSLFTGILRQYTATSLEEVYHRDPSADHRRLLIIGIYREEYSAYEDLGAIVNAFLRWRDGSLEFPIEGLLRYKPENVRLDKIFKQRKLNTHEKLYAALKLDEWIPRDWSKDFPQIDCQRVLLRACAFIRTDCTANQNLFGIDAYNRIKHGLALVPNGSRYLTGLPNSPAIIIDNDDHSSTDPYILMGLPMTKDALEERLRVVSFIESTLRFFTTLYVILRYSDFLKRERKIDFPLKLFNSKYLSNVKDFAWQLSNKT